MKVELNLSKKVCDTYERVAREFRVTKQELMAEDLRRTAEHMQKGNTLHDDGVVANPFQSKRPNLPEDV